MDHVKYNLSTEQVVSSTFALVLFLNLLSPAMGLVQRERRMADIIKNVNA